MIKHIATFVAASAVMAGVLCQATNALGADKPKRPTICQGDWTIATAKTGRVALCYGKSGKPSVFRTFATVELKTPEGQPFVALVGFR